MSKLKVRWVKKILHFKNPSGTSRGVLRKKKTYYLILESEGRRGIGECSPLVGLSIDDRPDYEDKLNELIQDIDLDLSGFPSIHFGREMALADLATQEENILYPSKFTDGLEGIPINGLIWMGTPEFMKEQIRKLLDRGFKCLKMKIGAIDFEEEIRILKQIRREYNADDLILRVDANGAYDELNVRDNLKRLAELKLHSIEQPTATGNYDLMSELCETSPIDIALDEELIPLTINDDKIKMLDAIHPQYIILKPSLIGGFEASEKWIAWAEEREIGWWVTSALESNIGLSAISQWTHTLSYVGHQGLGTGSLYTDNIPSPLQIKGEEIFYTSEKWNMDEIC